MRPGDSSIRMGGVGKSSIAHRNLARVSAAAGYKTLGGLDRARPTQSLLLGDGLQDCGSERIADFFSQTLVDQPVQRQAEQVL